jgi:hypothetical protein
MSLSIRQQVADGVRALLESWADRPADAQIERVYGIESYLNEWPGGQVRIASYVAQVDGERISRNQDQQEVTVAVAYLRKLDAAESLDGIDAADTEAESLWLWLRDQDQRLSLEGTAASRVNTTVPTPYSAEWLRNNSIYCQIVTSVYRVLSTR